MGYYTPRSYDSFCRLERDQEQVRVVKVKTLAEMERVEAIVIQTMLMLKLGNRESFQPVVEMSKI